MKKPHRKAKSKSPVTKLPTVLGFRLLCSRRIGLWRNFVVRSHHFIQCPLKINKAGRRNNYGISFAANLLGDSQEATTRILFQHEEKRLAFNLNLFNFKRVFLNERARRLLLRIGPTIRLAEGRLPFV